MSIGNLDFLSTHGDTTQETRRQAFCDEVQMTTRCAGLEPRIMDQKHHQNICSSLLMTYQGPALDDRRDRRFVFIPVLVVKTAGICAPSRGARAGGKGEVVDAVPAALCTFVCSRGGVWR